MEELKKISYQNTKETLKETTRASGRALKSAIKSLTDSAKSFIFNRGTNQSRLTTTKKFS